ncbi:MAG TPA: hypothetical protein VNA57_12755 [Acidimicrobiales bacterium]|nr:hypothetical protein [Acidimicrobiales bacterium]
MNVLTQIDLERRIPLYERLWDGPMFAGWHWLQWNFDKIRGAPETYFAQDTLNALVRCDDAMPGFAKVMLDRVASFAGTEKNMSDYGQIVRWLGELVVIHHFVTWQWPVPVTFEHEPAVQPGGMNPEILIAATDWRFGIEVKTPDLETFAASRQHCETQYLARVAAQASAPAPTGSVVFPRDNPVKDFLQSANGKFAGFREDADFCSALFIVWDDFINEPLSALLSPASGLLTPNTFDREEDGTPRTYPAVDAVVLMRQQHQLRLGAANQAPVDERQSFLDYGALNRFPPNAVIPLTTGREPPDAVVEALQAYLPEPTMGAEYVPAEVVWWISPD